MYSHSTGLHPEETQSQFDFPWHQGGKKSSVPAITLTLVTRSSYQPIVAVDDGSTHFLLTCRVTAIQHPISSLAPLHHIQIRTPAGLWKHLTSPGPLLGYPEQAINPIPYKHFCWQVQRSKNISATYMPLKSFLCHLAIHRASGILSNSDFLPCNHLRC